MWLRSGLSCILRYLVELCAPVSQTLRASVSHDSTRDADLLVSLLCMSFLLCSWKPAACATKRQTTIFMFCSCFLLVCIVVIATS